MEAHYDSVAREYRDNVTVCVPTFSARYDIVYRVFDRLPQASYANLFRGRLAQIRKGLRPICVAVPHRHASESSVGIFLGMSDMRRRVVARNARHACRYRVRTPEAH
jgi:hypothetical protein